MPWSGWRPALQGARSPSSGWSLRQEGSIAEGGLLNALFYPNQLWKRQASWLKRNNFKSLSDKWELSSAPSLTTWRGLHESFAANYHCINFGPNFGDLGENPRPSKYQPRLHALSLHLLCLPIFGAQLPPSDTFCITGTVCHAPLNNFHHRWRVWELLYKANK
jgi:hypothetical protein